MQQSTEDKVEDAGMHGEDGDLRASSRLSLFMANTVQVRMETMVERTKWTKERWKRTSGSPGVCWQGGRARG
jgi:hypothetical protein